MSSSFSNDRRNESDEISIDWSEVLDSVDWSEETESVEDENMSLSDFTDTDSLDTEHEMDVNEELDFIYDGIPYINKVEADIDADILMMIPSHSQRKRWNNVKLKCQ